MRLRLKPSDTSRKAAALAFCVVALGWSSAARAQPIVKLSPQAAADYDAFINDVERVLDRRAQSGNDLLWAEEDESRELALRGGEIVVEEIDDVPQIDDGLLHVWLGAMFVSGAKASAVLAVLKDYDHHARYYPEVTSSRTLGQEGDTIRGFLRLRKEQGLTVVLDTEHEAKYTQLSPTRWRGASHSTKIAEVENPDQSDERELPVGADHGFLWRLDAYWALEQSADGVFVECLSVSLSRQIPWGLGWLVGPFVSNMPRRTLEATLQATRLAVLRETRTPAGVDRQ